MSETSPARPVIKSTHQSQKRYFNALVHSFTKAGKTLSTAATSPRPLVILTEPDGVETLSPENIVKVLGGPENYEVLNTEVNFIEAFDYPTATAALDWAMTDEGKKTYDTLIMDSLSEFTKLALAHFLPLNKDGRAAYGDMMQWVAWYINAVNAQDDKNHLWLAHTERQEDQVDGQVRFWPWVEGKGQRNEIPYMFSEIWFIDIVLNDAGAYGRWLLSQEGGKGLAGSRNNLLDPYEPLDFSAIFRKMRREPAWVNPNQPAEPAVEVKSTQEPATGKRPKPAGKKPVSQ